jgi:hypothetical protein
MIVEYKKTKKKLSEKLKLIEEMNSVCELEFKKGIL